MSCPSHKDKEKRDYKCENREYASKPENKKDRAGRVMARAYMIRVGRAKKGDGKDVHHKDGNPRNNSPDNLSVRSVKKNRGWNKKEKR
tara:strand:- start:816 stop:1079 length:264 start_codon:yes stop_codon:yes gene_type:complete